LPNIPPLLRALVVVLDDLTAYAATDANMLLDRGDLRLQTAHNSARHAAVQALRFIRNERSAASVREHTINLADVGVRTTAASRGRLSSVLLENHGKSLDQVVEDIGKILDLESSGLGKDEQLLKRREIYGDSRFLTDYRDLADAIYVTEQLIQTVFKEASQLKNSVTQDSMEGYRVKGRQLRGVDPENRGPDQGRGRPGQGRKTKSVLLLIRKVGATRWVRHFQQPASGPGHRFSGGRLGK
jgi:hypothetical protein